MYVLFNDYVSSIPVKERDYLNFSLQNNILSLQFCKVRMYLLTILHFDNCSNYGFQQMSQLHRFLFGALR